MEAKRSLYSKKTNKFGSDYIASNLKIEFSITVETFDEYPIENIDIRRLVDIMGIEVKEKFVNSFPLTAEEFAKRESQEKQ